MELLNLAEKEIPSKKYNDARSLSAIVTGYIMAGEEQKGLVLAEKLKKDILKEYDYYIGLSPYEQQFVTKQKMTQARLYSMVVNSVVSAYQKMGEKDKAYQYLVESIDVVDKRFDNLIKNLEAMGRGKAYNEAQNVQIKIVPLYHYLFEVMKPFDSTYEQEKIKYIEKQIIRVSQ